MAIISPDEFCRHNESTNEAVIPSIVLHDVIELDGVWVAVRAYKQQENEIEDVIDSDRDSSGVGDYSPVCGRSKTMGEFMIDMFLRRPERRMQSQKVGWRWRVQSPAK